MLPFKKSDKLKNADAARALDLMPLQTYTQQRAIRLRQIEHHIMSGGVRMRWTANKANRKTRWVHPGELDALLSRALDPDSAAGKALRHFNAIHRDSPAAASPNGHEPAVAIPPDSPHVARARLANAKAEGEELKLAKLRGDLVDRKRAERTVRALSIALRQSWESLPTRAGPDLAARFGVPIGDMIEALDGAVRQHLTALSGAAQDLDLSRSKTFFDLYHDDQEDLPTAAPDDLPTDEGETNDHHPKQ